VRSVPSKKAGFEASGVCRRSGTDVANSAIWAPSQSDILHRRDLKASAIEAGIGLDRDGAPESPFEDAQRRHRAVPQSRGDIRVDGEPPPTPGPCSCLAPQRTQGLVRHRDRGLDERVAEIGLEQRLGKRVADLLTRRRSSRPTKSMTMPPPRLRIRICRAMASTAMRWTGTPVRSDEPVSRLLLLTSISTAARAASPSSDPAARVTLSPSCLRRDPPHIHRTVRNC
jgi:hypothetical protein